MKISNSSWGYPRISVENKPQYVHKLFLQMKYDDIIINGDHICEVKRCVNIDHLDNVSRMENRVRERRSHIESYFIEYRSKALICHRTIKKIEDYKFRRSRLK
jgi:hypothetical protein